MKDKRFRLKICFCKQIIIQRITKKSVLNYLFAFIFSELAWTVRSSPKFGATLESKLSKVSILKISSAEENSKVRPFFSQQMDDCLHVRTFLCAFCVDSQN